jgi:exopolysaccharide biosynthesis polyprenyl glycosylphosphotransferase
MKKSELFFSLLLVPLDFALLLLAALSAYQLRFAKLITNLLPVVINISFWDYFRVSLIFAIFWLVIFMFAGLYSIGSARKLALEIYRVVLACSTGFMLVVAMIFFQRELFNSRFIILAAWIFAIFFVSLGRIFVRWLQRRLFAYGIGVHKVILVGNSKSADTLVREFFSQHYAGSEVVKRVRDFSLETAKELTDFINAYDTGHPGDAGVDEIIQSDPNLSKSETLRLYDFATEHQLTFKYAADLLGIKVLRNEVSEIAGIPIVEVKRTTLEGWGRIAKRLIDIIGSGLLIIILSPILLLTAIIVKLDSHGSIFFSKRDDGSPVYRVGQGGKAFRYFKFRSMIPGSDSMRYRELAKQNLRSDGPLVKIKDDPRITRVGHFIRHWSIDELPELFLVFIGKMSLIGPRPHLPEEVAKYEQHHKKALTIKPGITGLAQISGRSDLLFEEEVKLDVYYIENWSLLLDASILLKTPLAVLKHRKNE